MPTHRQKSLMILWIYGVNWIVWLNVFECKQSLKKFYLRKIVKFAFAYQKFGKFKVIQLDSNWLQEKFSIQWLSHIDLAWC